MLETDGYVYLPGQIRATTASAARASVLFDDATDTEGRYLVWRTTFSGNKQLSRTHREFWARPGRDAYQ